MKNSREAEKERVQTKSFIDQSNFPVALNKEVQSG